MAKSTRPGPRGRESARATSAALREQQRRAERRRSVLLQGGVGLALVAVVVLATVAILSSGDEAPAPGVAPEAVNNDGAIVVGNADAPVTVQVVEDFQCPACRAFEAAAGDLLEQYAASDDVRVEYRGIAFLDRASTTEYSSRALNASACVMSEGTEVWKEFHDQLFLQQPPEGTDGLTDQTLIDIAVQAGAEEAAVEDCITGGEFRPWVQQTTQAALEDEVSSTPTVFVDGQPLASNSPAALQAAVEEALAE